MKKKPIIEKRVEFLDQELSSHRNRMESVDNPRGESGGWLGWMKPGGRTRGSSSPQQLMGDGDDLFQFSDKKSGGQAWSGFSSYKHKGHGGFVDGEDDGAGPGRLFSYFASGSFTRRKLLRHERVIQRNKAIVMMIAVGLALFWVMYKLSHM